MLRELREANIKRVKEWSPEGVSLSFRGNELAGETGEACNIIKKLERARLGHVGSKASESDLAKELADVIICADLVAMEFGINLEEMLVSKFNETSNKYGLTTKL